MSDYEQNTLDQLADMNYRIKLEQIGVRARPQIENDLVINNDFTKEMLDDYGKLYNQPIERYNPITGVYETTKYEIPVDDVDLETIDPLYEEFFGIDEKLINDNQDKINDLYNYMIDVDEYNKWKDDNLNDIKLQKLD